MAARLSSIDVPSFLSFAAKSTNNDDSSASQLPPATPNPKEPPPPAPSPGVGCALRGLLSGLQPALMSMIADVTRPDERILAYGLLALISARENKSEVPARFILA